MSEYEWVPDTNPYTYTCGIEGYMRGGQTYGYIAFSTTAVRWHANTANGYLGPFVSCASAKAAVERAVEEERKLDGYC